MAILAPRITQTDHLIESFYSESLGCFSATAIKMCGFTPKPSKSLNPKPQMGLLLTAARLHLCPKVGSCPHLEAPRPLWLYNMALWIRVARVLRALLEKGYARTLGVQEDSEGIIRIRNDTEGQ